MKRFNCLFVIAAALSGVVLPASAEGETVLKSEFLYEVAPTPACHASTIVETQGGAGCCLVRWILREAPRRWDLGLSARARAMEQTY